jgi:DNA-binding FadR family transcriptional regulator
MVIDTAADVKPGSARRRASLAEALVEELTLRLREGRLKAGEQLPTEGQLMRSFGVSRTVVRESLSRLQAAGLVQTRHGIGSFVLEAPAQGSAFRIAPAQMETLRDVVAVLELRIGVESEAAGLAAQRRRPEHLRTMRAALDEITRAVEAGGDAVAADFGFHGEIARATGNPHFERLLLTMGQKIIPRARLAGLETVPPDAERLAYLRRVNAEHESIYDAIASADADAARAAMRTHLANSRERRRRAEAEGLAASSK